MRVRGGPIVRLCESFNKANIPLEKLNQPDFRFFSEQYTQQNKLHPSTLSKCYVEVCYLEIIEKIRAKIDNNSILIQVDETIDLQKRCVAHIIVTPLFPDHADQPRC